MSDLISRQAAIDACIRVREYRAYDEIEEIKALPSAQLEKVDTPTVDTPTCEDAVSRQAVYNVLDKMPIRGFKKDGETIHGLISLSQVNSAIIDLPSAQPEPLDEWCTDCKEYDHERHCCPRWNRVIRQTLKDAQLEQWIPCSERLPEHRLYVLVTYKYEYGLIDNGITWYGETENKWNTSREVIAWMPLPEPYRAERRTDEQTD